MARRRQFRDWIKEDHDKEHVLTAVTMYGRVVEATMIPAKTDLRRLLIATLAKWDADGWKIESFCDTSDGFFCSKGDVRLSVHIFPASTTSTRVTD